MNTALVIRSIRTYRGFAHPWARGKQVVIVAVRRGEEPLGTDEATRS
jgi:hypothetical protein